MLVPPAVSPKNVLVIAFHFPPLAAAGTHRTLNFVRELARRGHRIGVVTTSSTEGRTLDDALSARVPDGVEVIRAGHIDPFRVLAKLKGQPSTGAAKGIMPVAGQAAPSHGPTGLGAALDWTSRAVTLPDRYTSWMARAFVPALLLGRRIDCDVIYSTAPPYSAHLLAYSLAGTLGRPWVADLRDPWTLNPFHSNPYPSLEGLDRRLEEAVIGRARRVILNTEPAEALYRARYQGVDKFTTITNGIAPEMANLAKLMRGASPNGRLDLLHVGAIYGRRFPAGLMHAMAKIAIDDPTLYERLEVEQVGPGPERAQLESMARELGVADHLKTEGPIAHQDALERCRNAAGLLLLGPSGDAPEIQVPSKLYEYLALDRPIVALAREGGAIASILERARPRYVLADPGDPAAIADALARFARGDFVSSGPADLETFGYEWLTSRLEEQLEAACEGH